MATRRTPTKLTRPQVQARAEKMFPGSTLPAIVLDLRAALNGSADPWPEKKVRATRKLLSDYLETWAVSTGTGPEQMIDTGVQWMVAGAVLAAKLYLAEGSK